MEFLKVSTPPLVAPGPPLTTEEIRRYSRHLLIPGVGVEGQRRLRNARVLCIGAGGLGSPILMYLAAAGVGTLGIVEFDTVDESNLQRQIIHGQSDLGQPKGVSAAASIREINPLVQVVLHETVLDETNALELFADYDVIVDGSDNFATRYLVNDAAVLLGKPCVWGSIYRFDGQTSVFWAERGPCYRCLYPEPPSSGLVPSCAEGGVLGVLCANIGAIQATEVIKLITGIGKPLIGRLMLYDALGMTYREIRLRKDPTCALCGEHPTITRLAGYADLCDGLPGGESRVAVEAGEILAEELASWQVSGKEFLLVDIRESAERDIVSIPGSVSIPQERLLSGAALADLPQDQLIVLYCRSGVRSARALEVLKAAGFPQATHLHGGVRAWVDTVDPSLPTY